MKRNWSYFLIKNWLLAFSLIYGLYVGLPFLAPVFMKLDWEGPAKDIYTLYSFLCHQLPQRSFFMFGDRTTYSLSEIQAVWQNTNDPWILRQFTGTSEMGWKVAWSDRMVSMYTGILFAAWLWYPFRKKLTGIPLWAFGLLILPMALDGASHVISDFAGIGQGFRDTNLWLARLTDFSLPPTFYAGDALGSFNSWMRLISGILFGAGIVLFGFPVLDQMFVDASRYLEAKTRQQNELNEEKMRELLLS